MVTRADMYKTGQLLVVFSLIQITNQKKETEKEVAKVWISLPYSIANDITK